MDFTHYGNLPRYGQTRESLSFLSIQEMCDELKLARPSFWVHSTFDPTERVSLPILCQRGQLH
jgi:hypothetical protein